MARTHHEYKSKPHHHLVCVHCGTKRRGGGKAGAREYRSPGAPSWSTTNPPCKPSPEKPGAAEPPKVADDWGYESKPASPPLGGGEPLGDDAYLVTLRGVEYVAVLRGDTVRVVKNGDDVEEECPLVVRLAVMHYLARRFIRQQCNEAYKRKPEDSLREALIAVEQDVRAYAEDCKARGYTEASNTAHVIANMLQERATKERP